MNISIDKYFFLFLKSDSISDLKNEKIISEHDNNKPTSFSNDDIIIDWGDDKGRLTTETGFFQNCIHIDKNGLYEKCSLNSNNIKDIIYNFNEPQNILSGNIKNKIIPKFNNITSNIIHNGPVLIFQHPFDRSILRAGGTNKYYEFIEETCKYFGKKLFVKFHPVNSIEIRKKHIDIAEKYGCSYGYTGVNAIDHCEFIILYNSTFAIDAALKNKPVFQYAPGYFFNSGIVNFIDHDIKKIKNESYDSFFINKFLNFIMWKYCFRFDQSFLNLIEIFKSFKKNEIFPLPQEYSYANYILNL